MKLLKLTIHNLASVADAEINFGAEPLNSKDLFLITGKTGSGKSTILDAICLALYGRTPRLANSGAQGETIGMMDGIKIDKPENLLRRRTAEGYAALEFLGNNDVQYEAKWIVKRVKSKPVIRELINLDTDAKFEKGDDIEKELDRAIGLNYDQFCRTSMLAQGEFTQFLKADNSKKAEILEKILGADIYATIGKNIGIITSKKKKDKELAEAQLTGVPTLMSEAEIAQSQKSIQLLSDESKQLEAQKYAIGNIIGTIDKISKAQQAIRSSERLIQETYLPQYVQILKGLNYLVESIQTKKTENNKLVHFLEDEASRKDVYDNAQTIIANIKVINGSRQEIRQQNEIIAALNSKRGEYVSQKSKKENAYQIAQKAFDKEDDRLKKEDERIEQLKLSELRIRKSIIEDIIRLIKAAIDFKDAQNELTKRAPKIQQAEQAVNICKALWEKQRNIADHNAQLLRQQLAIGEPCPICGCKVTTLEHVQQDERIQQLLSAAEDAKTEADKKLEELRGEESPLLGRVRSTTYSDQYKALLQKKLQQEEQNVLKHVSDLYAQETSDDVIKQLRCLERNEGIIKDNLEQQIKQGEEAEKKLSEEKRVHDQERKRVEQLRLDAENASKEVEKCDSDIKAAQRIIGAKNYDIIQAQGSINAFIGTTQWEHDWEEELDAFVVELNEKAETYCRKSKELDQINQTLPRDEETRDDVQQQIDAICKLHPSWKEQKTEDKSEVKDLKTDANGLNINLGHTITKKQEAEKEIQDGEKVLEDFCQQHSEEYRIDDPQLKSTLEAKQEEIQTQIDEKNQRIGRIQKELEQNQTNADRSIQIKDTIDKATKEYERWERLNKLIGGKEGRNFREIALSFVLYDLVLEANKRLKELNPRYSLNVALGTYVIYLEDAYDDYSHSPATTLSGGESFLVSLALALALSDFGGRQLRVDPLFIDEGFGTLSGELLDNAVDTLRSWSKSDRRIGIISHIESLQDLDRIPVQIQVKQGAKSSPSTIEIVPKMDAV